MKTAKTAKRVKRCGALLTFTRNYPQPRVPKSGNENGKKRKSVKKRKKA